MCTSPSMKADRHLTPVVPHVGDVVRMPAQCGSDDCSITHGHLSEVASLTGAPITQGAGRPGHDHEPQHKMSPWLPVFNHRRLGSLSKLASGGHSYAHS